MSNLFPRPVAATALLLTSLLLAHPSGATTLTVHDMLAADWAQTVLRHQGNGSVDFSVQARVGDPGNSFWQVQFELPASTGPGTSSDVVAHVYTGAGWNPASDGAIDRFDFGVDALVIASTFGNGSAGFVRPVVEQGGVIYSVASSSLALQNLPQFSPLAWHFEDTDAWTTLSGVGRPDFSASGAPLRFGYRMDLGAICNGAAGCFRTATSAGIDNFSVTITPQAVTPPGTVPEPAGALLLVTALAAVGLARRRRLQPGWVKTVSTPV